MPSVTIIPWPLFKLCGFGSGLFVLREPLPTCWTNKLWVKNGSAFESLCLWCSELHIKFWLMYDSINSSFFNTFILIMLLFIVSRVCILFYFTWKRSLVHIFARLSLRWLDSGLFAKLELVVWILILFLSVYLNLFLM